ncbi:MAG: ATP-binding protein [Sedimentisphaerales bacterium]|jgi:anti-sigma regulatory factor (Ser/Thr protein kinase)
MSRLYIPNSIALRNFDSIFKHNNFDFSDKKVEIHFHPTYVAMHPVGLVLYASLGDYFRKNGIETSATINYEIKSIPYLQRMGLFSTLGYSDPVETKKHEETGRFIPLTRITTSDELATFLKDIDPILHTTPDTSRTVKHVFSELLRNVLEHSQSGHRLGGHVCATYSPKEKKVSIGISDAGRGILEGMVGYKRFTSHKEAILNALKPGISGTTTRLGGTPENAGAGLFFTKCIAQSTRNHFLIYSGDSYFKLRTRPSSEEIHFNANPEDDYATIKDSLPVFHGTVVGIDIHIEDTTAFNKLMQMIGDSYRASLNKMKKDYYKRIKFS